MKKQTLSVIFRAERSGEHKGAVTAVFPTNPYDHANTKLTVYSRDGQHSSGTLEWYDRTRAANPDEYAALLSELKRIYEPSSPVSEGVTLKVCTRMTAQQRRAFTRS